MRFAELFGLPSAIRLLSVARIAADAKLIPTGRMISSKFGPEDGAKRFRLACVRVRAAKHSREQPRRRKTTVAQQCEGQGIRLQAIHNERFARRCAQKFLKKFLRHRSSPCHPRSKVIRKQAVSPKGIAL